MSWQEVSQSNRTKESRLQWRQHKDKAQSGSSTSVQYNSKSQPKSLQRINHSNSITKSRLQCRQYKGKHAVGPALDLFRQLPYNYSLPTVFL